MSKDRPVPEAPGGILADPEFAALRALSARLGRDPLRTQAAGGNTSLKRGGAMWIKASGTWLGEAESRDIMLPVRLEAMLDALAKDDPRTEKAIDFVVAEDNPLNLRPSVETAVHAVFPQPVVVHIHCVGTIIHAVRSDAEVRIGERLDRLAGIDWRFVPYVKPGVPLSRAIAARLGPKTNVVVLGNHGLIVAGETVAEAADLADRVAAALDMPRRPGGRPDTAGLMRLAGGSIYRLPADPLAHDVATDPLSLAVAERGTMYPDHVVFLGRGIRILAPGESPVTLGRGREPPMMLCVPGKGVLMSTAALRGADELARGLAEVAGRLTPDAPLTPLTAAQEDELIYWDAEVYRLALAADRK